MMHLEAICIGYAVPRRSFAAEVHSAFTSAANLRLVKGSRLLSLVVVDEADLPQGIRLNTPQDFSFERLHPGERVTCQDGILFCEYTPLTVDLRMARCWKCNLPALTANMNDPSSLVAWLLVEQVLKERRARARTGLPAGQLTAACRMSESVPDLVASTHRYDLTETARAVAMLIGLGPGLTPAGDDFLVGYLAGLWCAAGERIDRIRFLSCLRKAITRLAQQTNAISRTYLVHAAHGQVSSQLASLAEAICQGKHPDQLLETAKTALKVGHDSGIEAVTGLLVGLSAWDEGLAGVKK